MDEDDRNYKLIGGDYLKNTDHPNERETAYLLNDYSISRYRNNIYQDNSNRSSSPSNIINSIVNSMNTDKIICKLIIGIMLFHPIVNLIIQNNPNVKKAFNKSQRKLIKRLLILIMLICLIGFSTSRFQGNNAFLSFFVKFTLILFLLIHSNVFNITNFDETKKFWKKVLDNKKNK